ncbi:MAG: helix-turn-helix transcriptional regulator [Gammaproteobacteria bacterium]
MAKFCGLSTSCFSRTFKRINGLTFSKFVIQARLKTAMELLQDSHASITRVSGESGFRNLSHFSLTFRRHLGVSPTAYRGRVKEHSIGPDLAGSRQVERSHKTR